MVVALLTRGSVAAPSETQLVFSRAVSGAEANPSGPAFTWDDYSSLRFQAVEDAAIWSRLWIGVGFVEEIPSRGDILPFTAGHHGIHVERAADGGFTGRFNKAQHGGCRVVPLQCRTGAKTRCSFTACGYSRDRRPILSTDQDRDLHLDQYLGLRPERLLPVAVETFGPMLVARLDPQSGAERRWPLVEEVFGQRALVSDVSTVWSEFAADWKALAIAFAERKGAAMLFPNVAVWREEDTTIIAVLQPVDLDRTLCRIRVFGNGRTVDEAATRRFMKELRERAADAEAGQGALGRDGLHAVQIRARFEAEVCAAIEGLAGEVPIDAVCRTDGKDLW